MPVPLMLITSTLVKLSIVLAPLITRVSLPMPPLTARLVPAVGVAADKSMISFPAPALIVPGRLAALVNLIVSLASPRVSDLTLVSTATLIF